MKLETRLREEAAAWQGGNIGYVVDNQQLKGNKKSNKTLHY
jgi:hypothetical protein